MTSCLEYSNALLHDLPQATLQHSQCMQHCLINFVCCTRKHDILFLCCKVCIGCQFFCTRSTKCLLQVEWSGNGLLLGTTELMPSKSAVELCFFATKYCLYPFCRRSHKVIIVLLWPQPIWGRYCHNIEPFYSSPLMIS